MTIRRSSPRHPVGSSTTSATAFPAAASSPPGEPRWATPSRYPSAGVERWAGAGSSAQSPCRAAPTRLSPFKPIMASEGTTALARKPAPDETLVEALSGRTDSDVGLRTVTPARSPVSPSRRARPTPTTAGSGRPSCTRDYRGDPRRAGRREADTGAAGTTAARDAGPAGPPPLCPVAKSGPI